MQQILLLLLLMCSCTPALPRHTLWISDTHLDSASEETVEAFKSILQQKRPSALFLTGDLSHSGRLEEDLLALQRSAQCPLYFVLGNHDYYGSSLVAVRRAMRQLCAHHPSLHYLSQEGLIELSPDTALLGHDGWGDGRGGDFLHSPITLNDSLQIVELQNLSQKEHRAKLQSLGDEAAQHLRRWLPLACARYKQVIILTHVPPFRDLALYENRVADDHWAPHFVCEAVGQLLLDTVPHYPHCEVLVLCGHTHHQAEKSVLPNLRIRVGKSQYGFPQLQS